MTLRQDQQQPLTRRQLREIERAAQAAASGEQQVPAVALPFSSAPAPAPADLRPELPTDAAPAAPQQASAPQPSAQPAPEAPAPVAVAPVIPLTRRQLRALQQSSDTTAAPAADVPIAALPLPQASAPIAPVIAAVPLPEPTPSPVAAPQVIDSTPPTPTTGEVRAYQPPTGHWSLGASETADDVTSTGGTDAQLRAVESSGASSTTNALILPVVPSAVDMTGPLNATGEVLLTGSIDLPVGLGATGQVQGRFDGSDIDRMLDQNDRDAAPRSSVEPVAATRAIATHTPAAQPTIVPPKKASHRIGAVVGSVAGGIAALGVAGVLVAGFVFHAF